MAQRYPTDRQSLERDSDIDFFIASGPGGQHRNKVETGYVSSIAQLASR